MSGIKKLALGCGSLALLGLAAAVMIGLNWSGIRDAKEKGATGERQALGYELSRALGHEPVVAFVCRFPVVGIAPCVGGDGSGDREVTLTFAGYEPPVGVAPQAHALRIAVLAYKTSTFTREADVTRVVFEEGDDSASVVRTYSFAGEELAAEQVRSTHDNPPIS